MESYGWEEVEQNLYRATRHFRVSTVTHNKYGTQFEVDLSNL